MKKLQVIMKIGLVVEDENGGQPTKSDLMLAALPLTDTGTGYVSTSMELIAAPDMPKGLCEILGHTVPRLAHYVTEIIKNPDGNGRDIRETIQTPDLDSALARVMGRPGKLDS